MNFQNVINQLNEFWAGQGCIIWQPHNVQVGAGTANPATVLRVLGPEPWNVGYVEPSVRPADGRYGENPNRWQEYYQYQVILKPDPGNHIERYLQSLEAIGINWRDHDIRFVEDNWQSPSLGAWGLGWEVWLDGLEITQYTYFQQAGTVDLDPVCVEITYGLERIVMYLHGVRSIPDIQWLGDIRYGDLHLADEVDYCKYNFDHADIDRLRQLYDLNEAEAGLALEYHLVLPAHDYLLKCSHLFNVLDARGAIGITQRAGYFARMRDLARQIAQAYINQREQLGFPFLQREATRIERVYPVRRHPTADTVVANKADFIFEIGTEELPSTDLSSALNQLRHLVPDLLEENRLEHGPVHIGGTPRRLVIYIESLSANQTDKESLIKGPSQEIAFDGEGQPTQAAVGFSRSHGASLADLTVTEIEGKQFVALKLVEKGKSAPRTLSEALPRLIESLKFPLTMRWNETGVTFSRPIRWLMTLHGDALIDVTYANVSSDRYTFGLRPEGSPEIYIPQAEAYQQLMVENCIIIDFDERRHRIWQQISALADQVGGNVAEDPNLLDEVTNLVEAPTALMGYFDSEFSSLPEAVLITVMKDHQRYFPVRKDGSLMACFITVANGENFDQQAVRYGNEEVIRARFSDAAFFYKNDTALPLSELTPKLANLTFQEKLGSYLGKTERLKKLVPILGHLIRVPDEELCLAQRAADLCKADLVTEMVVEFPSLQGYMGQIYALKSGEDPRVAEGILDHYLPRYADDAMPKTWPGIVIGLADRLDSLVGLFAAGLAPTSSTDPYALRRTAIGLIQILLDQKISLTLSEAIRGAASLFSLPTGDEKLLELEEFIHKRLEGWLLDKDCRPDLVRATLTEQQSNPARAYKTITSLEEWIERPELGQLLQAYKRVVNIVRPLTDELPLQPEFFVEPASQRLYEIYLTIRERTQQPIEIDELLAMMLPLTEPINSFLNDVLVMHEDLVLRQARLGLLQHVAELPKGIVDLTLIKT